MFEPTHLKNNIKHYISNYIYSNRIISPGRDENKISLETTYSSYFTILLRPSSEITPFNPNTTKQTERIRPASACSLRSAAAVRFLRRLGFAISARTLGKIHKRPNGLLLLWHDTSHNKNTKSKGFATLECDDVGDVFLKRSVLTDT